MLGNAIDRKANPLALAPSRLGKALLAGLIGILSLLACIGGANAGNPSRPTQQNQSEIQQETQEQQDSARKKPKATGKAAGGAAAAKHKSGASGSGAESAIPDSEQSPAVASQLQRLQTPTVDELDKRLSGPTGLRSRFQLAKLALEKKITEETTSGISVMQGTYKNLIAAAEEAMKAMEELASQDLRISRAVKKSTKLNKDQAKALAELEKAIQAMEAVENPEGHQSPQTQPASNPESNSHVGVLESLLQRRDNLLQTQNKAEAMLKTMAEMDPDRNRLNGRLGETKKEVDTAVSALKDLLDKHNAQPTTDTTSEERDAGDKLTLAEKAAQALQDAMAPTVGGMLYRLNCAGRSGEGLSYRLQQAKGKLEAANRRLKTLDKADPRLEPYKKIAEPLPKQLDEAQQAVKNLCGSLNPQDSSKTASPDQRVTYELAETPTGKVENSLGKLPFDKEPKEKPEKEWITPISIFIVLAGILGAIFLLSPWRKGEQTNGAIPHPAGNFPPTEPDTAEQSRLVGMDRPYPDRHVKPACQPERQFFANPCRNIDQNHDSAISPPEPSRMKNTEPDISEVQVKALQHELAKTQQELRDKTIENTQLKTALTKANQIGGQLQATIQAKKARIEQLDKLLAGQLESSGWSQDPKPLAPTEPVLDSKENPQAQALESTAMLVIEEINKPEAKEMNAEALGNTIRQRMQNARLPERSLYFLDLFLDKEAAETWFYVLVVCNPGELDGEANALLFVRPGFKYSSTSSQYFDGGHAGEEIKEMLEPARVYTGTNFLPLRAEQRGKIK